MPGLNPLLDEAVRIKAAEFRIPEGLLRAMVLTECGGHMAATRYEPAYRWIVDPSTGKPFRRPPHQLSATEAHSTTPPCDFMPTTPAEERQEEWRGQRTSWGPLQVMGAVARELGHRGPFWQLSSVLGLYYGCLQIKRLRLRYLAEHGWEGVAAAYNAGTPRKARVGNRWENQQYIDKLRKNGARFEEYE